MLVRHEPHPALITSPHHLHDDTTCPHCYLGGYQPKPRQLLGRQLSRPRPVANCCYQPKAGQFIRSKSAIKRPD